MEISFDTIINGLAWLFGGSGLGWFITWRWQKAKAKAEAKQAEAEAKQKETDAKSAEIDMAQKVQDTYQQMLKDKDDEVADKNRIIAELREDRDHYRQMVNEMLERQDKTDEEVRELKMQVARNGRQLEQMRPFQCFDLKCKKRQRVPASECEAHEPEKKQLREIEPNNEL